MQKDIVTIILAYSCTLPALLGIVYYKRMDKSFHPFIWAMWLSIITETLSRFVLEFKTQPILYICHVHLYYLLHYLFFILFFYNQQIIKTSQLKYLLIVGGIIFILNCTFKPVFANLLGEKTIAFYLIIFYLAVQLLSQQVFNNTVPINKNPLFFIAFGLLLLAFPILENIIRIIVRYFYNLSFSKITVLHFIFQITNALSYLLFFIACIYIPKKA